MNLKNKWLVSTLIFLSIQTGQAEGDQKLTIYAVNYPLAYFSERIAGELASVVFPAPAGVDPAFWQPGLEVIRDYQQADLILLNGAGYAKWVETTSLPRLRSIDTSMAIQGKLIGLTSGISHSHGDGDLHDHSGTAFTTWLDLSMAAQQAREIAKALVRKMPQYDEQLNRNFQELEAELLGLDRQLLAMFESKPSLPLFASHPVYQYLAKRYKLNLKSVTWEPDQVPSPAEWTALKGLQLDHSARWMIWEANPNPETIDGLNAIGIESLVYQPMGNRPASGDFISGMRENLRSLEKIINQY